MTPNNNEGIIDGRCQSLYHSSNQLHDSLSLHVLQQLKNDKVKLELAYVLLIYVLLFVQFAQYKRCDKFHMIPGISLLFVTQLEWDLLDELEAA